MRVTLCEIHEKQTNNLGRIHMSFACPFCLVDSSVKAESRLQLAEGLARAMKILLKNCETGSLTRDKALEALAAWDVGK